MSFTQPNLMKLIPEIEEFIQQLGVVASSVDQEPAQTPSTR